MNSKQAMRAAALVANFRRSSSSHSSVAKKLSHIHCPAGDLQGKSAERGVVVGVADGPPIDGRTPASLQRRPNATDVY